jgi:antitoxin (DNA-binding transcriptional repressor) of toxin-antitoxin stability system
MKLLNVHKAKTNLSGLLAEIESKGTGFTICRNGKPIADLVPHQARKRMKPDKKLGAIKIKYDPTEELSAEEWPDDTK